MVLAPLFGLALLVGVVAHVTSCFTVPSRRTNSTPAIRNIDTASTADVVVALKLIALAQAAGVPADSLDLKFVVDTSINAASVGFHHFLVWDGVETLDPSTQAAILAHEMAHDMLNHVIRAQNTSEFVDFFARLAAIVSGSDDQAANELRGWAYVSAVPKYNQALELVADSAGAVLLEKLGSGNGFSDMANALAVIKNAAGDSKDSWFVDHPSLTKRIARLREMAPTR